MPAPVGARDGRLWVAAGVPSVPEARPCVLARWVGGRFLNRSLNPARLAAVGAVIGALHNHAAGFAPPPNARLRWDWAWEFGAESVFAPGPYTVAMADADRATLQAVEAPLRAATAILGTGPAVYSIIHADLHQYNYLFQGERVGVIDFGDCGLGYYLYDLAVTTMELDETRSLDIPALRAALLAGYRSVRPLHTTHAALLDLFIAARYVDLLSWMGHSAGPQQQARAVRFAPNAARKVRDLPPATLTI